MHLKGLSRETLTIEQARYICTHFIKSIEKVKSPFKLTKDNVKLGIQPLTDIPRSQPTMCVADVTWLILKKYPDIVEASNIYESFTVNEREFDIFIKNGCKSWHRFFKFTDPELVATNYANYFSALFSCNISRIDLQDKLSRNISRHFGIPDLSSPSFASIGILIGMNSIGVRSGYMDVYKTEEIASNINPNHSIAKTVFCGHGIARKIIAAREDDFYNVGTAPEYWCEIHLVVNREEYKAELPVNVMLQEAVSHYRKIDKRFTDRLISFLESNDFNEALAFRDLANALYIAWEFNNEYPDYQIPVPTQRALGALSDNSKQELPSKTVLVSRTAKQYGRNSELFMPVWESFLHTEQVMKQSVEANLLSIYRSLSEPKKRLLNRLAEGLVEI